MQSFVNRLVVPSYKLNLPVGQVLEGKFNLYEVELNRTKPWNPSFGV